MIMSLGAFTHGHFDGFSFFRYLCMSMAHFVCRPLYSQDTPCMGINVLEGVQVENLANRTDLSKEEKERRRHKLEKEIAAGVVGVGILGFAGYKYHQHRQHKQDGYVPVDGHEKHRHHHHHNQQLI